MVRALLDGSKTQTRRLVKNLNRAYSDTVFVRESDPTVEGGWWPYLSDDGESIVCSDGNERPMVCPYGKPGDRLWVRETFAKIDGQTRPWIETDYRATYTHGDRLGDLIGVKKRWTPAIHMPRWASRIDLEVTGVRVERLQDISEEDAKAEGTPGGHGSIPGYGYNATPSEQYQSLWEEINGAGSWAANPWVWVVEFGRVRP